MPNYANGGAATTVELKNAVEFSNESNEFNFHETQQDLNIFGVVCPLVRASLIN